MSTCVALPFSKTLEKIAMQSGWINFLGFAKQLQALGKTGNYFCSIFNWGEHGSPGGSLVSFAPWDKTHYIQLKLTESLPHHVYDKHEKVFDSAFAFTLNNIFISIQLSRKWIRESPERQSSNKFFVHKRFGMLIRGFTDIHQINF